MKNKIPQSVLIADTRNKLSEIVNHPLLPPPIVELILKEAWQSVAIKAHTQLISDYEKYQQSEENIKEGNENDGL